MTRVDYFAAGEAQAHERPEDVTDSEWGRLEELQTEGLREVVRIQSRRALELARQCHVEVPDAHNR